MFALRVTFTRAGAIDGWTDYEPWGMPMVGRMATGSLAYRYGFQGQETDQIGGVRTPAFELRLWDSRIGRWTAPDPYGQFWSPYVGMGNNPVNGADADGGWFGGPGRHIGSFANFGTYVLKTVPRHKGLMVVNVLAKGARAAYSYVVDFAKEAAAKKASLAAAASSSIGSGALNQRVWEHVPKPLLIESPGTSLPTTLVSKTPETLWGQAATGAGIGGFMMEGAKRAAVVSARNVAVQYGARGADGLIKTAAEVAAETKGALMNAARIAKNAG